MHTVPKPFLINNSDVALRLAFRHPIRILLECPSAYECQGALLPREVYALDFLAWFRDVGRLCRDKMGALAVEYF